jgi:co-chaperonin GroES (HSP10)
MKSRYVKPLGNTVLVRPYKVDEKITTKTGIELYRPQQNVSDEQAGMDRGVVVELAKYAYEGYDEPWVKPGDHVIWPRYAGRPIFFPDSDEEIMYHIVVDTDIKCTFDEGQTVL